MSVLRELVAVLLLISITDLRTGTALSSPSSSPARFPHTRSSSSSSPPMVTILRTLKAATTKKQLQTTLQTLTSLPSASSPLFVKTSPSGARAGTSHKAPPSPMGQDLLSTFSGVSTASTWVTDTHDTFPTAVTKTSRPNKSTIPSSTALPKTAKTSPTTIRSTVSLTPLASTTVKKSSASSYATSSKPHLTTELTGLPAASTTRATLSPPPPTSPITPTTLATSTSSTPRQSQTSSTPSQSTTSNTPPPPPTASTTPTPPTSSTPSTPPTSPITSTQSVAPSSNTPPTRPITNTPPKPSSTVTPLTISPTPPETPATPSTTPTRPKTPTPPPPPTTLTTKTSSPATTSEPAPQRMCPPQYIYHTTCLDCTWPPNDCDLNDKKVSVSRMPCKLEPRYQMPYYSQVGCQAMCQRFTSDVCCRGFWGSDCQGECPGGYKNPCSGNGVCEKNGTCTCLPGFTGGACEYCKSPIQYGSNCFLTCECAHGKCLHFALHTGGCDCESGYRGVNCDIEIHGCKSLKCTSGMQCVEKSGSPTCICPTGYKMDPDENKCKKFSPCAERYPGCEEEGSNSTCRTDGPGQYRCSCNRGFTGNGILCSADPCLTNTSLCPKNTTCKFAGPDQYKCECDPGFEPAKTGKGCVMKDICTANSCSENAVCKTVAPLKIRCKCKQGYSNGLAKCMGNILQVIKDLNDKDKKFSNDFDYVIHLLTEYYEEPITKHGPFTIFVPTDRAFKSVTRQGFQSFLQDKDRAMQIMRQHMLIGMHSLRSLESFDQFTTLEGNDALLQVNVRKGVFKYKLAGSRGKAKVLKQGIHAVNGMVHIVNNLLTTDPVISGDPQMTAMEFINQTYGSYSVMADLIEAVDMGDEFSRENITVLGIKNKVWTGIPTHLVDHLKNNQDGREKLRVLLRRHILLKSYDITHIVDLKLLPSAHYNMLVQISRKGKVRLGKKINIVQANIPVSNGFIHDVDGLLYNTDDILNNFCNKKQRKSVRGRCVKCSQVRYQSCPRSTDTITRKVSRCRRTKKATGCQRICLRDVTVRECCKDFYGSDCRPCPGELGSHCSNQGKCSDGFYGSGTCTCNANFAGLNCERCRSSSLFGPSCTEKHNIKHQSGQCKGCEGGVFMPCTKCHGRD